MDEATLWRLAEVGVVALPPGRLAELVQSCWDRCETTGDARYCVIARALDPIAKLFDEAEEYGGVEMDFAEIDVELRTRVPAILQEPGAEAASLLARSLREEIWRLLVTAE